MDEKWNIDAKRIASLLKNQEYYKRTQLINLYKNYNLICRYANPFNYSMFDKENESYSSAQLSFLEDKVYTINGRILSDSERILIEYKRIIKYLKTAKLPDRISSEINDEVKELLDIPIPQDPNTRLNNDEIILYLKKRITLIQALLGLKIKFFSAAIEAFYDEVALLESKELPDSYDSDNRYKRNYK